MANKMVGYARVSSINQCEDRQIIALKDYGVEEKNIYLDKQTGKTFERPQYQKMLRSLRKGDTLVFPSVDRMGRDYQTLLEQWENLMDRGIHIVVLDMPILDTRSERDLSKQLITDMVLRLMAYVGTVELNHIHARQAAGIKAAQARGVHMGRPKMEKPPGYYEYLQMYRDGKISARKAAKELGISPTSFRNWAVNNIEERSEIKPDE